MEARKKMVIADILAPENKQYIVPIYQREYKWTGEQINRLLDDIFNCKKTGNEHFIGSIVYQHEKDVDLSNIKLYLVDGQQRLTTMMLITKALNLIANEMGDDDSKYVISKTNKILYIDSDDVSRGYKVEPSQNDREIFNLVISSENIEMIENNPIIKKDSLIYNNFKTSYYRIKDAIKQGMNIKEDIYNLGFLRLSIVEIVLNYNENAQEIFESLNSLGVPLSNADLIRNFLLMSNKEQKSLYIKLWKPMQDSIIGEANMEMFVKNYLLMKKAYAINDKDIYKEYTKYAREYLVGDEIDRAKMLNDLYETSTVFEPFLRNSSGYSKDTNLLMKELRDMDQSTAYPFLMQVFIDRKNKIIDEETLNKVINLIIVYLVRRTICKVPTNTLRGFMLNLYKRIFKVPENKDKYYESIYAFLTNIKSNDYLRSEADVKKELLTSPIYRNVKFTTYLLYRLENGRYPNTYTESVITEQPTVEHIMPQNLTGEWIDDLGGDAERIHSVYLNTLGNLSLSSRSKNSSMSDESFKEKKKILTTDGSKFNVLNKDILSLTRFTENDIINRENRLEKILLEKYSLGVVDTRGIRFEDSYPVTCTDQPSIIFNGANPLSFILFDEEVYCDTYAGIVTNVSKILLKRYPEVIRELASKNYNPWGGGEKKYVHYTLENDNDNLIGENIRVHTGLNAMYSIDLCVHLLKECSIDPEQLTIILKKDSIKKENTLSKEEKVDMIRKVLDELSQEGKIIYSEEEMPDSDSWIKFQLKQIADVLPFNGMTKWDSGNYASMYYHEFNLSKNQIIITLKYIKQTKEIVDEIVIKLDNLGVENDHIKGNYLHIMPIKIDFNEILDCDKNERSDLLKQKIVEVVEKHLEILDVFIKK